MIRPENRFKRVVLNNNSDYYPLVIYGANNKVMAEVHIPERVPRVVAKDLKKVIEEGLISLGEKYQRCGGLVFK